MTVVDGDIFKTVPYMLCSVSDYRNLRQTIKNRTGTENVDLKRDWLRKERKFL
jgi:hypothetical protein